MSPQETAAAARPRVEGDREQEILDATLDVLADAGYDRLTMDAVATAARASKATLYRRWNGKVALVVDALLSLKSPHEPPDTGTLRGDLLSMFCGMGGLTDRRATAILASVITAIGRDEEFAGSFRERFIAPKAEMSHAIYARAHERGELREGLDLELVAAALPGIVLHREFLLGESPSPALITRVIDQLILPAVLRDPADTASTRTPEETP